MTLSCNCCGKPVDFGDHVSRLAKALGARCASCRPFKHECTKLVPEPRIDDAYIKFANRHR